MGRDSRTRKMWARLSKRRHDAREKRRKSGEKIVPNRRPPQDANRETQFTRGSQRQAPRRMTRGDVERGLFMPLFDLTRLSSDEYGFLKRVGFTEGYFDYDRRQFVVRGEDGIYYGRGDNWDGWNPL